MKKEELHRTFNDIADAVDKENKKSIVFFGHKINQKIKINGEEV